MFDSKGLPKTYSNNGIVEYIGAKANERVLTQYNQPDYAKAFMNLEDYMQEVVAKANIKGGK